MDQLEYHLTTNQTKKVLDIGTGVGNFIFLMTQVLKTYDEIVGIDTSERAVELAKSYFPNQEKIKFIVMDAKQLDFPDDHFDAVSLSNSLHHLTDAKLIFNEMERVLKPNGVLLIHEMISKPLTPKQESHKLIHHFSAEIDRCLGLTHDTTYTKEEIVEKLSLYSSLEIVDSWIPVHKEKHIFSQEEVDQVIHSIDQMLNRILIPDQLPYFKQKADDIKTHIKEHGFDLATQYMFILRKREEKEGKV